MLDGAAGLDVIHGGGGLDSPETLDNGETTAGYAETTPASWTNVSPAAGFNNSARQYTGGLSSQKGRKRCQGRKGEEKVGEEKVSGTNS